MLIREVAYESIPRRDRSDLHLQVATWLQAAALAEEPVAELAHHYEQAWRLSRSGAAEAAAPSDEVEAEAVRSENGGMAALAAGQAEEATAAFARAVDHWRQLGLTVWLGRALSLQAAAARGAGDRPTADRLLIQAGEVLDRITVPAHARPTVLAPLGSRAGEGQR